MMISRFNDFNEELNDMLKEVFQKETYGGP
jgi:hypothetical protein